MDEQGIMEIEQSESLRQLEKFEVDEFSQTCKPRLRGIPDVFAAVFFVPAGAILAALAAPGLHTMAATVYALTTIFLFAVSASYHAPHWNTKALRLWRTADHSAIYIAIAGTYTPVGLVVLGPEHGIPLLAISWTFAVLGVAKSIWWENAPRWLNTSIYLGMGWLVAPLLPEIIANAGYTVPMLYLAGGIVYSIGAIVYQKRFFNFSPRVFGYHESFHVFVISGALLHFAAISLLLG